MRVLAAMCCAAAVALQTVSAAEPAETKPLLTILFSAEAHGALLPCNCPLQPLGGIARRGTAIKSYRERGPVLLIDAGGWAAGGIYDEQSDGDRVRDDMRTDLMVRAIKLMNYDMVCADDRTGNMLRTQFACVNRTYQYDLQNGAGGFLRLSIDEKGEEKVGLWVNSTLRLAQQAALIEVPRVIVCRLGEEESSALAASQPAQSLVINAGRKTTSRDSWRSGASTVANFDYQVERLGVVEVFPGAPGTGQKFEFRVKAEALTSEIPDDPDMATLLRPFMDLLKKTGKKKIQIEFWTMPECPGCVGVRPELQRISDEMGPRVETSIHFVVHKEAGQWSSLHGPRELHEARIQALVQKYYPEKIWQWMAWREAHREAPLEEGAREFGILAARLRGALAGGEGDALLEADYDLMQRRHVEGTPTLIVANRLYDNAIEPVQLLRVLCGLLEDPKPAACKDVPACFFDAQCKKRGFIGHCVDAGKSTAHCDADQEAVKVPATVIVDKESLSDNHEHIMELLIEDLPGIEFKLADISEPAARELVARLKIPRLPAYLIDSAAKKEAGYGETVGKAAVEDEASKTLVLQNFAVGSTRILNRNRIKGRADLFVSRSSKNGQEALEAALEFKRTAGAQAPELVLHDILLWKENGAGTADKRELAAPGGLAEIEEAARGFAVKQLAPEKYEAYLLERGKRRGSSYWDSAVSAVGADPVKVRALAESPSGLILQAMYAEAELLKSLDAGGEIVFLAENCEVIPIRSHRELRQILEKIGPKR